MKKKRAALHNLGCKVNAYETEAMQQILESAGYEIVPFQEVADVYVVNTCSVTNMADRKSRQMLHRAKKNNPDAIVIAAGCYVQTKEAEALLDGSPAHDGEHIKCSPVRAELATTLICLRPAPSAAHWERHVDVC